VKAAASLEGDRLGDGSKLVQFDFRLRSSREPMLSSRTIATQQIAFSPEILARIYAEKFAILADRSTIFPKFTPYFEVNFHLKIDWIEILPK
jgi:hypothetical protein